MKENGKKPGCDGGASVAGGGLGLAAGAAGEGHAALRRALEIYRRIGAAEAEGLEEELGAAPGNGG